MQNTVNVMQAPGIPVGFYDDSPRRVRPAIITSGALIGNAVTYVNAATDPQQVIGGGSGPFGGIVVNGKELVRVGGLSASLAVSAGSIAPVATMGHVWVAVKNDITAT